MQRSATSTHALSGEEPAREARQHGHEDRSGLCTQGGCPPDVPEGPCQQAQSDHDDGDPCRGHRSPQRLAARWGHERCWRAAHAGRSMTGMAAPFLRGCPSTRGRPVTYPGRPRLNLSVPRRSSLPLHAGPGTLRSLDRLTRTWRRLLRPRPCRPSTPPCWARRSARRSGWTPSATPAPVLTAGRGRRRWRCARSSPRACWPTRSAWTTWGWASTTARTTASAPPTWCSPPSPGRPSGSGSAPA